MVPRTKVDCKVGMEVAAGGGGHQKCIAMVVTVLHSSCFQVQRAFRWLWEAPCDSFVIFDEVNGLLGAMVWFSMDVIRVATARGSFLVLTMAVGSALQC